MKLRVGIVGATGAVGQKFVKLLEGHPWFVITALAASERSAGKSYRDAVHWLEDSPIPSRVSEIIVQNAETELLDCDFIFSGLDSSVAGVVEERFARAGFPVISNAKNFRTHPQVPLLIPEVNPDHLALIEHQDWGGGGFIVTNPNCASVGITLALKPLYDAFGIDTLQVTTMQALSGAGYPGVPSLDAVANVVPFIGGEEEKVESEPLKLLGKLTPNGIQEAMIRISAQCTRVPVIEGHMATLSFKLATPNVPISKVLKAIESFKSPPEVSLLPTSPEKVLAYSAEDTFPQPRRHVLAGKGMTVSIGRVRSCSVLDFKMVCLAHNTIRGAAGGALLNAELLAARGMLKHRSDL